MNAPTTTILAASLTFALLPGVLRGAPEKGKDDQTPSGKAVFLKENCNKCHAVSTASIVPTDKKWKKIGSDLSKLDKKGPEFSAKLVNYLRGKEKRGGKDHVAPFKGTDEELQALVDWLGLPTPK